MNCHCARCSDSDWQIGNRAWYRLNAKAPYTVAQSWSRFDQMRFLSIRQKPSPRQDIGNWRHCRGLTKFYIFPGRPQREADFSVRRSSAQPRRWDRTSITGRGRRGAGAESTAPNQTGRKQGRRHWSIECQPIGHLGSMRPDRGWHDDDGAVHDRSALIIAQRPASNGARCQ